MRNRGNLLMQLLNNSAHIIRHLEREVEELMEELDGAMDEDENEQVEFDSGYAEEMAPEIGP